MLRHSCAITEQISTDRLGGARAAPLKRSRSNPTECGTCQTQGSGRDNIEDGEHLRHPRSPRYHLLGIDTDKPIYIN